MHKYAHLLIAIVSIIFATASTAQGDLKRYLYLATPDAAQEQGQAEGSGILIFDIDDGHKLVRRIDVPEFAEGLRGFAANKITHSAYFSTQGPGIGAFDLETEEITWQKQYELGSDRSSITLDGKKVYVPTGWWVEGDDSGLLVLNGDDGSMIKHVSIGNRAHNSLVSVDGRYVYLGTSRMLTMLDTKDESIVAQIPGVGENGGLGVFPYTVNSTNTIAYVSLGSNIGFDIVDLQEEKILHHVLVEAESTEERTHGAALLPDETELWISDQEGRRLFIFDNTQMPPKQIDRLDLTQGGHGWVTFSLDGQYAWTHTPDVFDTKTKEIVATLRDENGTPVSGSKYIEVHFRAGEVVEVGNEFGLGRR